MFKWILAIILLAYMGFAFSSADIKPESKTKKVLKAMWGQPAEDLTIMPYLIDHHLKKVHYYNEQPNPMLCITYKGFFAGTLVNSYYIRTYVLGVQRYWLQAHPISHLDLELGYRLGVMYGL